MEEPTSHLSERSSAFHLDIQQVARFSASIPVATVLLSDIMTNNATVLNAQESERTLKLRMANLEDGFYNIIDGERSIRAVDLPSSTRLPVNHWPRSRISTVTALREQ